MPNIWDNVKQEPPEEYADLYDIISFEGYVYDSTYRTQEVELLQPRLEAKGYHNIQWHEGERDCFGPLSRTCRALDDHDQPHWFFYG